MSGMGYLVLTDTTHKLSVLYCTTSDRPLDHESFRGDDSLEQAEDFLDFIGCDPRDTDGLAARGFTRGPIGGSYAIYQPLDHAISAWHEQAFDPQTDEFRGVAR